VQRPRRCTKRITIERKLPRLARSEAASVQTQQAAMNATSLVGATRNKCAVEAQEKGACGATRQGAARAPLQGAGHGECGRNGWQKRHRTLGVRRHRAATAQCTSPQAHSLSDLERLHALSDCTPRATARHESMSPAIRWSARLYLRFTWRHAACEVSPRVYPHKKM